MGAAFTCNGKQPVSHPTIQLAPKGLLDKGNSSPSAELLKKPLSKLPEAEALFASRATLDDLADVQAWPVARPLSAEDIVVVKGAWNRILAWKDATIEAMVYHWIALAPEVYDLLSVKFDELPHDLFTIIDKCVRALDARTEVHHRESYTAGFPACVTRNFGDTPSEVLFHYTIMGVKPRHWALLKESFLFAMRTHNPYKYQDHDGVDLDQGNDGAIARFFHLHVVGKAHKVLVKHLDMLQSPASLVVQRQARGLKMVPETGQSFYERLLTKYPELCDYFANTNMDHLAQHLHKTLVIVGAAGITLPDALGVLSKLAHVHTEAMIPTGAYSQVGEVLCEVLSEAFEMTPEAVDFWVYTYMCCATVISAPMAVEERVLAEARDFFRQLAGEEHWGPQALDARMKQVEVELGLCGTYRHTAEELQAGARLAWRNAPKCIGRIAWDTLLIRDRRYVTSAQGIFDECKEHLKIAAGGGVVQSLMTIFAPRKANEKWGTRFWNSQFCRYAGYRQSDGSVLGDPANVEFTEMVMDKFNWQPPRKRTPFDPLPQIVQLPGEAPVMCEFPRELFCEIPLSHPQHPGFASLGLRWTGIPVITVFNMRIGGVDYPCCPFNGWFVDLEIARNLVERYGVGPQVAKICGYDTSSDSTGWRCKVMQDVCCAVTHSFQRKKFSIVDHYSVSCQFLTHVDREKRAGREVPAQWSWIGGFAGMHCPVWGYEMRDFYLRPQYHYCCDKWVVDDAVRDPATKAEDTPLDAEATTDCRRVLILFASSTGTSERFARTMAKELGSGYRPKVLDLDSFNADVAVGFSHILCFVATFNDGDPPNNGSKFPGMLPFRLVNSRTLRPIKFAVMCLGSSIYPKFCAFGQKVDRTLEAAGGMRFVNAVLSDEVKGHAANFQKFRSVVCIELEPKPLPPGTVEPFLEISLVPSPSPTKGVDRCPEATPSELRGHMRASVVGSDELFKTPTDDRSTRRISIDISGCASMRYATGGHLSVLPCNPHEEVVSLCDELKIPREQLHWKVQAVMVEGKDRFPTTLGCGATSLYDALKWHFDISVRSANLDEILQMVRDAGGMTAEEFGALTKEPEATIARFWWISRVLRAFPLAKGKISLTTLITNLGIQFPRLYSIASSSAVSPLAVELCVGLVVVQGHRGIASSYLHGLEVGSPVLVACKSSSFALPEAPQAPIIMVGAGTGVAPYVAFVQERMHLVTASMPAPFPDAVAPVPDEPAPVKLGDALLFTGCRRRDEQICIEVFEGGLQTGALGSYSTSLSREAGVEKRHVTQAMSSAALEIWAALQHSDCHYYFCGDGRMADSAYSALLKSISQGAGISRAKAVAAISQMRAEGRYHLDVWGVISHGQVTHRRQKVTNMAKSWLAAIRDSPMEPTDSFYTP